MILLLCYMLPIFPPKILYIQFHREKCYAEVMEGKTKKDCEALQREDQFDRLPNSIVCMIFNKVMDAKSLCRCLAVSKRFSFFIPQTDTISFTISNPNPNPNPSPNESKEEPNDRTLLISPFFINSLLRYLVRTISTIHDNLHSIFDPTVPIFAVPNINHEERACASYILPDEALRNFRDVQSLHIELPCHLKPKNGGAGDPLLKWKAQAHNGVFCCVILLARSLHKTNHFTTESRENSEESSSSSSSEPSVTVYGDKQIQLATSCFGDAIARYFLTFKIALNHPTLRSVVISDANRRGKVLFGKNDLHELIKSPVDSSSDVRGNDVEINLWYAPLVELPSSGYVMEEATLIMTRPVGQPTKIDRSDEAFMTGAFEEENEAISEAVKKLNKLNKETRQVALNLMIYC